MTAAAWMVIVRAKDTVHGGPKGTAVSTVPVSLRLPSRDSLVPIGVSQAPAEPSSEKGTDPGSPQKCSATPTKHAKVRGREASGPRHSQGLAVRARCPLS